MPIPLPLPSYRLSNNTPAVAPSVLFLPTKSSSSSSKQHSPRLLRAVVSTLGSSCLATAAGSSIGLCLDRSSSVAHSPLVGIVRRGSYRKGRSAPYRLRFAFHLSIGREADLGCSPSAIIGLPNGGRFLVYSSNSACAPSRIGSWKVKAAGGGVGGVGLHKSQRRISIRKVGATEATAMDAPDSAAAAAAEKQFNESEPEALVPVDVVAELIPEALVWASLNGLVVGDKAVENSGRVAGVGLVHAPLSLLPTPFPADAFKLAVELSTLFNDLVDKVSQDTQFLQQTLSRTQKADDFTARLLDIHSKITEEGLHQDIRLGLHRSDYMLDMATGKLLQVELNTISSSFPGLGSAVSNLHKYLVSHYGSHFGLDSSRVPVNKASDSFAAALALAWKEYGNESAAILMIVQPEERNMYDQQWLSFKLKDSFGVRVMRRTLGEVISQAKLSKEGTLYIGEQIISVVYYRAGYTPNDYPTETEWEARLLLERSAAIKCPSISYHLTGAKKIQQELAMPGVLERYAWGMVMHSLQPKSSRFLQDSGAISTLRQCFAGLWGLESSEVILEEAISAPHGFVLKPQREGGGNNIYGEDVARRLTELRAAGGDGLAAYILMQRIFPTVHTSYLVRGGIWSPERTISELGIYGAYLRNGPREVLNEYAGHLLRTKVSHSNEGGVATGFAVLDSPYLS